MKRILAIIMVILIAVPLFGCSETPSGSGSSGSNSAEPLSDDPVTITMTAGPWQEYAANIERLFALYKEARPNVTIECNIDGSALTAQMAAKNYPELMVSVAYGSMSPYVEYLADLNDNETIWREIEESTWDSVTYDGVRRAVPLNTETYGLIYNKKLFADAGFTEPPKTISEFRTLCENLQANGITPIGFGFKEDWIMNQFLVFPFGGSEGFTDLAQKIINGETRLNDTYFYKNYQQFVDLAMENCQDKVLEGDYTTQVTLFAAGQVAMISNGDWTAGMITEVDPDIDMGIMGMPYTDNEDDYKVYVSVSNSMGVFKDSANVAEGIRFVEWLVSSTEGKNWIGQDWGVSTPVKNVDADLNVLSQDGMDAVAGGYSGSWGDVFFPGEASSAYWTQLQKYILGETEWVPMMDAINDEILKYTQSE